MWFAVVISLDNSAKAANDNKKTKKLRKERVKKVKNNQDLDGQDDPSNTNGFDELNGKLIYLFL